MPITPELAEALRKIKTNNFNFTSLPNNKNDSIWKYLLKEPYNLTPVELNALKNSRIYCTCLDQYVSNVPISDLPQRFDNITAVYDSCCWAYNELVAYDNCCWAPDLI